MKNKIYSHELSSPKPVTTGSIYELVTTAERETETERGERTDTAEREESEITKDL